MEDGRWRMKDERRKHFYRVAAVALLQGRNVNNGGAGIRKKTKKQTNSPKMKGWSAAGGRRKSSSGPSPRDATTIIQPRGEKTSVFSSVEVLTGSKL